MLSAILITIALLFIFHKQLAYVLGFVSQALILTMSLAASFLASGAVIGIFLGIVYLIKDIF